VPIREVVSQISPPIRILLVLTVAVLGVYMLFVRPKPEEAPPPEPANTSVSEPGKARDAAQDAVDAANGQIAQQEGVEAGEAAAGTATKADEAATPGTTTTPAQDLTGLPKPVRRAIRQDKVLVMLFWNPKSADDRDVHRSLGKVRTHDGRVFVHAAPLKQISRYGRIARGVSVEQSPTIVIADRDLKAQTLIGFVDPVSINQAVVDTLKNTNGLFTDAYLRQVDKVCVQHSNRWAGVPFYYFTTRRQASRRLHGIDAVWASFVADFKAVDAPKKWRAFRAASLADMRAYGALIRRTVGLADGGLKAAAIDARVTKIESSAMPIAKRANERFRAEGLLRCGSQF
jgi:hypothetical protein